MNSLTRPPSFASRRLRQKNKNTDPKSNSSFDQSTQSSFRIKQQQQEGSFVQQQKFVSINPSRNEENTIEKSNKSIDVQLGQIKRVEYTSFHRNKENSNPNKYAPITIGKLKFPYPKLSAKAWAIFEVSSSKMIWGSKCHRQREVASLTKIMSFITALEICKQNGIICSQTFVRVSQYASSISGTSAGLTEGSYISLLDLFYALMLPSGNDAAWVLAESLGALTQLSKQWFDKKLLNDQNKRFELNCMIDQVDRPVNYFLFEMNKYSRELNILNSTWNTPHGLNNKYNKSSAYDMGRLTCKAMQSPIFRRVVKCRQWDARVWSNEGELILMEWLNTNKLLDDGWEGVKTGVTPNAGPCLSACYNPKRSIEVVVVLLCCKTMEQRWEESKKLIDWLFNDQ